MSGSLKPKFKVGDKVRILPSATSIMVSKEDVGKTGVVTVYDSSKDIIVYMDKPLRIVGYRVDWLVEDSMIELAVKVGQQLTFDFMEER
jgi:ribosomal protein L21E